MSLLRLSAFAKCLCRRSLIEKCAVRVSFADCCQLCGSVRGGAVRRISGEQSRAHGQITQQFSCSVTDTFDEFLWGIIFVNRCAYMFAESSVYQMLHVVWSKYLVTAWSLSGGVLFTDINFKVSFWGNFTCISVVMLCRGAAGSLVVRSPALPPAQSWWKINYTRY